MGWAVVGKVATLIGVILGLITLWKFFSEKHHRVTMEVDIVREPAPRLKTHVRNVLSESLNYSVLRAARGTLGTLRSADGGKPFSDLQSDFAASLLDRIAEDARFEEFSRLVRVTLENNGKKTAKAVTVDLDFEPFVFQSNDLDATLKGKSVRLPEIRPGQKVVLSFWTRFEVNFNVRATHEDHTISQTLTYTSKGWRAFISQHAFEPYVTYPLALGLALLIILLAGQSTEV